MPTIPVQQNIQTQYSPLPAVDLGTPFRGSNLGEGIQQAAGAMQDVFNRKYEEAARSEAKLAAAKYRRDLNDTYRNLETSDYETFDKQVKSKEYKDLTAKRRSEYASGIDNTLARKLFDEESQYADLELDDRISAETFKRQEDRVQSNFELYAVTTGNSYIESGSKLDLSRAALAIRDAENAKNKPPAKIEASVRSRTSMLLYARAKSLLNKGDYESAKAILNGLEVPVVDNTGKPTDATATVTLTGPQREAIEGEVAAVENKSKGLNLGRALVESTVSVSNTGEYVVDLKKREELLSKIKDPTQQKEAYSESERAYSEMKEQNAKRIADAKSVLANAILLGKYDTPEFQATLNMIPADDRIQYANYAKNDAENKAKLARLNSLSGDNAKAILFKKEQEDFKQKFFIAVSKGFVPTVKRNEDDSFGGIDFDNMIPITHADVGINLVLMASNMGFEQDKFMSEFKAIRDFNGLKESDLNAALEQLTLGESTESKRTKAKEMYRKGIDATYSEYRGVPNPSVTDIKKSLIRNSLKSDRGITLRDDLADTKIDEDYSEQIETQLGDNYKSLKKTFLNQMSSERLPVDKLERYLETKSGRVALSRYHIYRSFPEYQSMDAEQFIKLVFNNVAPELEVQKADTNINYNRMNEGFGGF